MALCVRTVDTENINPAEPSTSALAVVANEVISPDEEAVCAVDWHPGIPENDEEDVDDETNKCPACNLGMLRWFYLDDNRLVKFCNNILCTYPLDCNDSMDFKPKLEAEKEIDSKVETLFTVNDNMSNIESVPEFSHVSFDDIYKEMSPIVNKYLGVEPSDQHF